MGMLGNIKNAFGANPERDGSEPDASLDIVSAIEAHVRWKIRLEAHINGTSTENLDPDTVCKDDQCTLGRWIHGHGRARYGAAALFLSLEQTHAKFHRSAADIIRQANAGDKAGALAMLNEGVYAKYSYAVKTELARLCRAHGDD